MQSGAGRRYRFRRLRSSEIERWNRSMKNDDETAMFETSSTTIYNRVDIDKERQTFRERSTLGFRSSSRYFSFISPLYSSLSFTWPYPLGEISVNTSLVVWLVRESLTNPLLNQASSIHSRFTDDITFDICSVLDSIDYCDFVVWRPDRSENDIESLSECC